MSMDVLLLYILSSAISNKALMKTGGGYAKGYSIGECCHYGS